MRLNKRGTLTASLSPSIGLAGVRFSAGVFGGGLS